MSDNAANGGPLRSPNRPLAYGAEVLDDVAAAVAEGRLALGVCVTCESEIETALVRLGSVRCANCRQSAAGERFSHFSETINRLAPRGVPARGAHNGNGSPHATAGNARAADVLERAPTSTNGTVPHAEQATPELSLVVPTRNEVGNIAVLVSRLQAALSGVTAEIIFVDDSDDATPQAVTEVAAASGVPITLIHRPAERRGNGLSGAVVEGMRVARGAWVCVMDADLQHPPELVRQMLDCAHGGDVDLVLASRYCDKGSAGTFGLGRSLLSKGTTGAARVLFPRRLREVSDPMSGFFLVRRDAVDLERLRPRGFKILLEILVRSDRLRVTQIPFEFGDRLAGESKASLREGARYVSQLWDLRWGGAAARFAQFGLVGASGLVVNTLLLFALASAAGLNYLVAALLATQGSTLWNFLLTEKLVFRGREGHLSWMARVTSFFAMNNLALALRVPLLFVLTSLLGIHYLVSNVATLVLLAVLRFGVADRWIWAERGASRTHAYDIHGIVSVESEVGLPELERFRVDSLPGCPTIRVRIGKLSRAQSDLVAALAFLTRHTRYDEGLGRFGFGIDISMGRVSEVVASPLLKRSPHVLYTNVVEPMLRWTFVKKGYALVHGACVAVGDNAFLITARTDTGKTTTILKTLDGFPGSFLSDDMTLVSPDGRVLSYPKPLTISRHTVQAVKSPLLTRRERLMLVFQSRLHSRSGRRFAMVLAQMRLPVATINAIVQLLVPPPKYHVERLIPGVLTASEARLRGLIVIQRGGEGDVALEEEDALDILLTNCADAYGFPPYAQIESFLHGEKGHSLETVERQIIADALAGLPATLLRSETMDWWERLPAALGGKRAAQAVASPEPGVGPAAPLVEFAPE